MDAREARLGRLGARAHRRLRENESYDELILLSECDDAGRQSGVETPELDEALDYLRQIGPAMNAADYFSAKPK